MGYVIAGVFIYISQNRLRQALTGLIPTLDSTLYRLPACLPAVPALALAYACLARHVTPPPGEDVKMGGREGRAG